MRLDQVTTECDIPGITAIPDTFDHQLNSFHREDTGVDAQTTPHAVIVRIRNKGSLSYPDKWGIDYVLIETPNEEAWDPPHLPLGNGVALFLPDDSKRYHVKVSEGHRDGDGGIWIDVFLLDDDEDEPYISMRVYYWANA